MGHGTNHPTMADPQRLETRIEAMLSQLSNAANLGISPEELLTRAIDGLLQVARATVGVACLVNPESRTMRMVSVRGIRPAVAEALRQVFPLDVERAAEQVARPIRFGEDIFPGLEELYATLTAEGVSGGMLLPLCSEGRLLGLLMAMFRAGGEPAPAFSDSALLAIQRQLSTALQNSRVRQGLQSLNTDLLRLLTLAKILGEPRELEDTLTMVGQAARTFSRAVATVIWLAAPAARRLTRIVLLEPEGSEGSLPVKFAYGEGVPGWVAETGEALHLDDALTDPRVVTKEWAQSRGIRSVYAFPLRFKDALVGVLSVGTTAPLPSPQLSLLGIYCDHAALAIGHAQLLRETDVHAEHLSGLAAASRAINEGRPREVVLSLISESCRRATEACWFSVWGADNQSRELHLLYADPGDHGLPGLGERIRYGSGLAGWAALHRQARVTRDVQADPLAGNPDWCRTLGVRAIVALPLLVDNELLGVLQLGARAPLGSEHLHLVEAYAALTAIALRRV
ncbi:MAG: GAF domain-containing protein [Candidatus Rokubacteria bacterium]|nr:GAF domain-containing protein [Candidatus Rokubacteria bacterium]